MENIYQTTQKEFLMIEKYVAIILDKDAKIVEFESTIKNLISSKNQLLGTNWFDLFVESNDTNKVLQSLSNIFCDDIKVCKQFWKHLICTEKERVDNDLNRIENNVVIYDNGKKALSSKDGRTIVILGIKNYFILKSFQG